MSSALKTRSSGVVLDPDQVFPLCKLFQPVEKLPNNKSVICLIRYHVDRGGAGITHAKAISEVAKQVYAKWYSDTVYCVSLSTIVRRLSALWSVFFEGRKRLNEKGKENCQAVKKYKELVDNKEKLFDVYATDQERRKKLEIEWGVKMSDQEIIYYEDQAGERRMFCSKAVDPVWYHATMRAQRLRERHEEYRRQRDQLFAYKSVDDITEILRESGDIQSSEDEADSDHGEPALAEAGESMEEGMEVQINNTCLKGDENCGQETSSSDQGQAVHESNNSKTKRKFNQIDNSEVDPLPSKYRHIRSSERIIRNEFYSTVANLTGAGLSLSEATNAVVLVGNGMFDRNWKSHESEEYLDNNTAPSNRNVRTAVELVEAQSLSLTVENLEKEKEEGRMLTHASDSTTKRRVGHFIVQGIHVGQNLPFPLPILPIAGEKTEDIAMQVDMGFEILAAVRGVKVEEVYSLVDTHMTDSVDHNKGFAVLLQEMYNLDKPAGQIFCGSHTTLGFASAMNKVMRLLETDMKMEQVLKGFMVDLDVDTKNSSIAGQALDVSLKLVAPEFAHKPWNRNKEFLLFLADRGVDNVLFAYKDSRFGCLSRAAAVLVYIFDHLVEFLNQNPGINNRLACLAREVLALPYIKPVMVVFACLGVYLVEPFYARTIEKGATHTQLKHFYKDLHKSMGEQVKEDYIKFSEPQLNGVSEELFIGVKKNYGEGVLKVVSEVGELHKEEVYKLTNLMLPELRTVLARQRRDYGIDEESFPQQYPVEKQASNIEDTPVHNIGMERQCGKVDYRLHKLGSLSAVSRSIILQRTQQLREGHVPSFRGFKAAVKAKRELELVWSEKTQKTFQAGSTEKQELAQRVERKRLDMLDMLKERGGPFTDADEVDQYLDNTKDGKEKQKRMKMELQFARDSSTLLPKVDPLFKIQVTLPTGKRRDKNAQEFGEALKSFLGRRADRSTLDYDKFADSLERLSSS